MEENCRRYHIPCPFKVQREGREKVCETVLQCVEDSFYHLFPRMCLSYYIFLTFTHCPSEFSPEDLLITVFKISAVNLTAVMLLATVKEALCGRWGRGLRDLCG